MSEKLRIGVIGLGGVAQLHHLPNLCRSPRVDVAALCDRFSDLSEAVASAAGLPPRVVATSADELMGRDLDAVLVLTRDHAPLVHKALDAGLHVFVEKPVCWSPAEADEIVMTAAGKSQAVVVGYMKRFDPALVRLQERVEEAHFVRVHVFGGARHKHERLHRSLKSAARAQSSADDEILRIEATTASALGTTNQDRLAETRTIIELGIHDLNLIQWLFGPTTVVSARRFTTSVGRGIVAILEANGVPITLEMLADFSTSRDWDESVAIFDAGGMTELCFGSPFLTGAPTIIRDRRAEGTDIVAREVIASRDDVYRLELEHFLDCALGLAESRTPVGEAAADLALAYQISHALDC
jgi:predicted dehydrogenase